MENHEFAPQPSEEVTNPIAVEAIETQEQAKVVARKVARVAVHATVERDDYEHPFLGRHIASYGTIPRMSASL